MEWFSNLRKNSSSNPTLSCNCKWNECDYEKEFIPSQELIFWNKYNYFVSTKRVPDLLFNRHIFYVKDQSNNCLFNLQFGLDPIKGFEFVCLLNCTKTNNTLQMNLEQSQCFFQYCKVLLHTNIYNPFATVKFTSNDREIEIKLKCDVFNGNRSYEMKTEKGKIIIDDISMKKIIKMEPVIERIIAQLVNSVNSHKVAFQRFIGLFITWSNFENLYSEENQNQFFTYLSKRSCECGVNNNFAMEIALNFDGCMMRYLPWYTTALLMNENVRKYTFVKYDGKLNVDILTKSGLILCKMFDMSPNYHYLRCVFCSKQMRDGEITKNPIIIHFKNASGKCPLLVNAESTENIPTNGCNTDLKEWISQCLNDNKEK